MTSGARYADLAHLSTRHDRQRDVLAVEPGLDVARPGDRHSPGERRLARSDDIEFGFDDDGPADFRARYDAPQKRLAKSGAGPDNLSIRQARKS